MKASEIVELAAMHLSKAAMLSSAQLNLDEAREALAEGDEEAASRSAARSLKYSVGIFHEDYRRAALVRADARFAAGR